jgi:DNA repair protein RadC
MEYRCASTEKLLSRLIGDAAMNQWYRGSLLALFESENSFVQEETSELFIACELIEHMQVQDRELLSSSDLVCDYLKCLRSGREYECFVVLFLDTGN